MGISSIKNVEDEFSDVIAQKKETARSALAIIVIVCYVIVLLAGIGTAVYLTNSMDSVLQVIAVLSGIFTGPMVMVITYYFKEKNS